MKIGYEFNIVRVLCHACGWQRKIGYTGIGWYRVTGSTGSKDVRAVIRVEKSEDPRHILHGRVLEFPPHVPLEDIKAEYPEFRDLQAEAHEKGLIRMLEEFQPLVEGAQCPRCKKVAHLCLDSIGLHGEELKYLGGREGAI